MNLLTIYSIFKFCNGQSPIIMIKYKQLWNSTFWYWYHSIHTVTIPILSQYKYNITKCKMYNLPLCFSWIWIKQKTYNLFEKSIWNIRTLYFFILLPLISNNIQLNIIKKIKIFQSKILNIKIKELFK